MKIKDFLSMDTETTGLLAPSGASLYAQPYITEIFVGKFNKKFELVDEFYTYVKPPIPIPEHISKITGITDETVEEAPSFLEIYDDLYDFLLGESHMVGQNINFDLTVLRHELSRHEFEFRFPWPKHLHDTIEKSFSINNKRMRLGDLYLHCTGRKLVDAHTAKADTLGTVECFKWLQENGY